MAVSACSLSPKIFHSKNAQLQVVTPTVDSVSPVAASTFGGANITISGGGFQSNTQVALTGGAPCLNVRVQSPTTLQCVLPPTAEGNTQLIVSTPGASGSTSIGFSFKSDLFTQVDFVAGSYTASGRFVEGSGIAARFADVGQFASDGTYLYMGMGHSGANFHVISRLHIQSGQLKTFVGDIQDSGGTGDGAFATAQFLQATGITRIGRVLYVSDNGATTIRKLDLDTQMASTIAGQALLPGNVEGDGLTLARFTSPGYLANDGQALYIVDGSAIRKYDLATHLVTTLVGLQGTSESLDGSPPAARLYGPDGIVFAAGALYITDRDCLREINVTTGEINTFAGKCDNAGDPYADGIGPSARFIEPTGLTTDGKNLYVADSFGFTIRKVVIATGEVTTIAGNSTVGVPGTNEGPIGSALLSYPVHLIYDATQGLLVSSGLDRTEGGVTAVRRIH